MGDSERLSLTVDRIAAVEASSRILADMVPSHGYQGFRAAPIPAGCVPMGESWVLWWNGRQIANVSAAKDAGARVRLDARKMWQTKDVSAGSIAHPSRRQAIDLQSHFLPIHAPAEQARLAAKAYEPDRILRRSWRKG
ncbi:hypothetical protein [Stenotrophomonas sp. ATs4]|uniref:hypothetical protein n=1 Tax=Stenotrophomonas sp. ATs4 TaxID=3402766 RepID=UPI003F6F3D43